MSPRPRKEAGDGVIATNRAAFHNYFVLETVEAGMALYGTEIKSLRAGGANLREGFIRINNGEAWLVNVHISPYEAGNVRNHEPDRDRKLLMHKAEIIAMATKVKQKGLTLIPLRMYWSKNRAKLEIGLGKGKRQYDKREAIAARDARREMDRARKTRV
jgi:SsrA-binding protein